jgi:hypothetical protein
MSSIITKILRVASQLATGFLRLVSAALPRENRDDKRQLHDSDLTGEYNYRTGRLDAGNDPYGWYDDD